MRTFYQDFPQEIHGVLIFEAGKFEKMENGCSRMVRQRFSYGHVKKGLALAKRRQDEIWGTSPR